MLLKALNIMFDVKAVIKLKPGVKGLYREECQTSLNCRGHEQSRSLCSHYTKEKIEVHTG